MSTEDTTVTAEMTHPFGTSEATVEMTLADGTSSGPVPLASLTRQLTMFEGVTYHDIEIRLSGSIEGNAADLLPDVTTNRIGDTFEILVHGEITAKKHQLKRDKEGFPSYVLVVTLKIDHAEVPID